MLIKKILRTLGISAILLMGCLGGTLIYNKISETEYAQEHKIEETQNLVTISAVGDIMVHGAQLKAQLNSDNTYNFDNNFKYIKDIISNTDISIANLETTINKEKAYSGYPNFNSPVELVSSIKDTGFDIISTINNHSLDTGYKGVLSTLDELQSKGLKTIGTKTSSEDKNYIIEDINNIKIGFASFSYGDIINNQKYLNGIKSQSADELLNVISSSSVEKAFETIKKEIDLMRLEGAEFIVLSLHWGKEYDQKPTNYQKQLAQLLANEGVDLILGSHPHVVQPIEYVKSENSEKECLVVYSMGNIISNQREEEMGFKESENGIIPIITIEKDENNIVSVKDCYYIPTWVNKYNLNNKNYYEIIPIISDIELVSQKTNASVDDLRISKENTMSLMSDERISLFNSEN